ncbi:filaggrin-2 [Solea solea]|uniref:filaggrin-2 n=1 Tax=Solea solea TaxID=90069 RepID=UPI00272D6771|nr:filaggrin-2 [Solea solea]
MCDRQEKNYKHGKTVPHQHQNQDQYRQKLYQSDDDYSQDTRSKADGSILNEDHGRHHCQSHHDHHKPHLHRASLPEISLTSSAGSSSSSPSSFSSSSSSCSSFSSSSSSSSFSSDTSSDCWDRAAHKKPRHSQSCTDITGKHGYFDGEDDTAPLIDKKRVSRRSVKGKRERGKSSRSPTQDTANKTQKIRRGSRSDGNVRKSKSMEALSRPKDREEHENCDENEQERRKSEARKNLTKEKMKFSAFLNEITRQVLSPMRLTTLGVTDAQRPCSSRQASVKSSKMDSSTNKHGQQKSWPTSADSVSSSERSHTGKQHSTQLSKSKSFHHSRSHHSGDSPSHMYPRPKSCTDISCLKRAQSPQHHNHTPSNKGYHRHQGDHASRHHHRRHHCEDCNCLNNHNHHRDQDGTDHLHRQGHHGGHHSPTNHHGNQYKHNSVYHSLSRPHHNGDRRYGCHFSPTCHHGQHCHRHGNRRGPSRHHSDQHGHALHHGEEQSTTFHYTHGDQSSPHNREGHTTPSHPHLHGSGYYHHHQSSHPKTECPTTSHHHRHHSSSSDHGNHHSPPHHHHHNQHHLGDHHSEGHHYHHGDSESHQHHHGNHQSPSHRHGDHHNEITQHHHGNHQSTSHHHGDHHNEFTQHHHGDHYSPGHNHQHGDHHRETYKHHHGDHYRETHEHHHGDHHRETPERFHGDQHRETHEHHHGDHHRETHEHHHGNHCSFGHQHHHGDKQSHWYFHEVEHNRSHLHHHDNHHSDSHLHHHSDHSKESHPHLHDNHRSDSHHHSDHSKESHPHFHSSESHLHHHGDHNSESHLHHHEDDVCHHQGHHPESHVNHDDLHTHLKGPSARSPPSHKKSESHTNKADLPSNPRSRDEEQTSFLDSSSSYKEKPDELGRIMKSQDKDDGLHRSSLRTECSGEEFMNNQRLLEAELQKTRIELSNLTERFKRLHDSCSSTEQTNDLLQKNLHSMAQSMEGERERLNRRISALTEQLTDAKFTDNVETGTHFNATSALHNTNIHFQSDGAINQVVLPITPPPTQFMDSHDYGKAKVSGQEQSLGSVPEEEEESDWSEMGEEIPRFILTGLGRNQVWRHQEGDMDGDSESGGEETFRLHSQIPHLQFTIHSEILPALQTNTCPPGFTNLSEAMTVESSYRITSSPALCSSILIRSASLEELPHRHMLKELRGTEAMMDLHHHPSHEVMEDLEDEIIHHWRTSSDMGAGIGSAMESSLVGLRSAEQMLNHFICESQLSEGKVQSGAEVHGWTGGIRDEVLKGERTEL